MSSPLASAPPGRVASVDVYRGFVMFLMLAGVTLHLPAIAKSFPDSLVWQFLGWQQSHVEWRGCTLHDLIQPSFSFLVGVALPFSLANRAVRGQRFSQQLIHAIGRAAILIALAVLLRSTDKTGTRWEFTDTLGQIGLGYVFLFLLGFLRPFWHWLALAVIVVGYWAAFATYPMAGDEFHPLSVGVKPAWQEEHGLEGFAAHWNKNANLASDFDRWFLNQFPRREVFQFNSGGYATLNFVPTLGTMILGLIAGTWLRWSENVWWKIVRYALAGLAFLGAGYALDMYGICPSVKRIWTPAWVLLSGGWCFLLLAAFHTLLDTGGPQGWSFPFRVIGANSIAAYCMATWVLAFLFEQFDIHLGRRFFEQFGPGYDKLARGGLALAVIWLVLFWMYRRKIFLRI